MTDRPHELPGLIRAIRVLRERWWIVVASAVACTAAALALSLSAKDEYTAKAQLLFRESSLAAQAGGSSPPPDSDPDATKATNLLLVTTTDVAAAVKDALKLDTDVEDLLHQVKVEPESNANVVTIAVTDPSPRRAADIANAWAREFTRYSRQVARDKVKEGQDLVRERLSALPETATEERRQLGEALTRLILLESVQTGDADVLDIARVPRERSAPNPKRNAALALLAGGLLGVGLVFLLNVLDRRLKSLDDFEEAYDRRALAAVPLRSREPAGRREQQAALEPFRILRSGLAMLAPRRDVRVVVITSAVPGEGKTTVAAGLARALALAGERVVLVEADLRRPTLRRRFDVGDDPRGLTTALIGDAPVGELLRTVLDDLPALRVLPSGPLPPNSAELLRGPEMGDVLRDLREHGDVIVLDAPPLLPVADAQVLLDRPDVDTCLVVGRAYRTTREQARRTRAVVEGHAVAHVGLVVNGVRAAEQGYEYYGVADDADTPRLPAGTAS